MFCHFSKAFDKVWHRGLLLEIKSYDIDGNLNGLVVTNNIEYKELLRKTR